MLHRSSHVLFLFPSCSEFGAKILSVVSKRLNKISPRYVSQINAIRPKSVLIFQSPFRSLLKRKSIPANCHCKITQTNHSTESPINQYRAQPPSLNILLRVAHRPIDTENLNLQSSMHPFNFSSLSCLPRLKESNGWMGRNT